MATSRFTLGSILTTVSTTANALTSSVASIGAGADMLNAFVGKQASEQAVRYAKEALVFEEKLTTELADDLAESAKIINAKKAKDPEYAQSFDYFYQKLSATKPV